VFEELLAKRKVVEAHRPGRGPKFTSVELRRVQVTEHGDAVVVTCIGHFKGPQFTGALKFMRVWLKKADRWQIVAGSIHQ